MAAAPLSQLMSETLAGAPDAYERFLVAFVPAMVGIRFEGRAERVSATNGNEPDGWTNARVIDGGARMVILGGKRGLRVCADPEAFRARFGAVFNALVDGATALRIAEANPECDGLIVNSALTEHSAFIPRGRIAELLAPKPRPWWKLW